MAIPTPPAAPNPLGANFAAEALAFTQWMHTAAPEFNTAVTDANAAVGDAEQAVLDAAAQVGLATTQAGLATTNGAAQVALAASQVTLAATSATTATTQAGIATTQASNAATSAATATTQAGIATTKAAEAAASAASIAGGPVPEAPSDGKTYGRKDAAWSEVIQLTLNNLPALRPSLLLDFANSKQVDPRITFTRASTATYYDAQGVLRTAASGVPRIDHDPVTGECKGLLIEEARTNRCPSSADIGFDGWVNGPNIQVLGRAIAPDGTNTATVFGYLGVGGAFSVTSVPVSAGETATVSAYLRLKAGTFSGASIIVDDALDVRTSLYTGAAGTPVLDGTWRRHSITITNANTAGNIKLYVAADFAPGTEIEVWGAQLEAGAFPSSYIPTTAAEITRAAEIAYITQDKLQAFTKPNSGTVFAEYSIQGFSKTTVSEHSVVTMGFEGGNYAARLRSYSNAVGNYDSDSTIQYLSYPFDSGESNRAEAGIRVSSAVSYGSKGAAASAFGEFKGTNTTPFAPTQHSVISLGNFYNTNFLNGHIRRVYYFPAELSATELNALTAV